MHYLVTGGGSDLARTTVQMLVHQGHRVSWVGPPLKIPAGGKLYRVVRRDMPWRSVDLRAVDGIVHLAGPHPSEHVLETDIKRRGDWDRAMFRRAAQAGVERVITVSVVANPRVRELPFVRLKRQTESILAETGIPATVFRVPWLYGPNDDFLTRLWRWVRNRSVLLVPGLSDAPVQLCSEAQLAGAIVAATRQPASQMRIYEAATTTPLPLNDLLGQLGRIVRGAPPRTVPVSEKAFHLRGPLRVVGLIPLRSPAWALLEGGLTCATTAFEREFDVTVTSPNRALIEFVRQLGSGVPWWGRSIQLGRTG